MRLSEAKKGQLLEVIELMGDRELNSRLNSFGIGEGAKVRIVAFGAMHSTIKIEVDDEGCVALRHSEADVIEVREI